MIAFAHPPMAKLYCRQCGRLVLQCHPDYISSLAGSFIMCGHCGRAVLVLPVTPGVNTMCTAPQQYPPSTPSTPPAALGVSSPPSTITLPPSRLRASLPVIRWLSFLALVTGSGVAYAATLAATAPNLPIGLLGIACAALGILGLIATGSEV